jgi:Ca-activated chloride channel family protein
MRSFISRSTVLCLFLILGLAAPGNAEDGRQGLFISGESDSSPAIPAPVLGATIEVKVTGIIARTRITQIFKNVANDWVEGIYIFPLPANAAVDTLRLKVGARTILGEIRTKADARQAYAAAKQQGVKASLVEQQRPDVFTTAVAHIGPGETVEVSIELQQVVRWEGGRFNLRFPMVVAPRTEADAASGRRRLWLPPVLRRGSRPVNPFAFHADLNPGFPLAKIESPSHAITVAKGKQLHYAVDLAQGIAPADSDLVLEWTPAVGREPRGVYYSEEVNGERYSLLMVMPPDAPGIAASRLPRETIFIIDNSGSMQGTKLEQARQALLLGLSKLRPGDWFNVIRFSYNTVSVFPKTVPASAAAVEQARRWVTNIQIDGGTKMLPSMAIAFHNPPPAGVVPQVIFATDGQLEDEPQVVKFLNAHLGERRLFPVAIGPDPNVHLLRYLAAMGRGSFTAITDTDKVGAAMGALFSQLESPMLQGIDVRWGDAVEAWPARVPDLYLGDPLVVTAKSAADAGAATVSGHRRDGETWQDSFPAAAKVQGAGIDKLWARQKIEALTASIQDGASPAEVHRAIAGLGLRHHLVTDYTSLVAVDGQITAPVGLQPIRKVVPVNPPASAAPQDVITVTAESPLLDQQRLGISSTVSAEDLAKIPTARDPWTVLQAAPGVLVDRINVGTNESGLPAPELVPNDPELFDGFEKLRATLLTAETKALCEEVEWAEWEGITLERVLRAAPSQEEALVKANANDLLRGFILLLLHDKGCVEPPPEVLYEAREYGRRFGLPSSDKLPER